MPLFPFLTKQATVAPISRHHFTSIDELLESRFGWKRLTAQSRKKGVCVAAVEINLPPILQFMVGTHTWNVNLTYQDIPQDVKAEAAHNLGKLGWKRYRVTRQRMPGTLPPFPEVGSRSHGWKRTVADWPWRDKSVIHAFRKVRDYYHKPARFLRFCEPLSRTGPTICEGPFTPAGDFAAYIARRRSGLHSHAKTKKRNREERS